MSNIEQELKDTINAQKSLVLSESHLNRLEGRLLKSQVHLKTLEKILDKEYQDIVDLEKLSIKKIFSSILGDTEEQLEIERQEYLEAILNHKDHLKGIELMEFERDILKEKLKEMPVVERKLERLIKLRESQILQLGGTNHTLLRNMNGQIDDTLRLKREIYEAKIVGTKVKVNLQQMILDLAIAGEREDWNSEHFDKGNGRGHVNRAQEIFYKVKQLISQFEDELMDIYSHRDIKILRGIDNIDRVMKIYYDNLISDWVVKKRIYNSLHTIESLNDRVLRTLASLEQEERQANQKITYLEKRKKEMLIKQHD